MAIVTGGLGQPEEGALVASGLGHAEPLPPGSMSARLAGSGSITGGIVALGHLAATLSGLGEIVEAGLVDGNAGGQHTTGSVTGVTLSTGVADGFKHSLGSVDGSTSSTGTAGAAPAPLFPDVLPVVFGISLDPTTLHRKRRTRGAVRGLTTASGVAHGSSHRRSSAVGSTASTGTARGYSRLTSDDDEVMLLLGHLTPVG